MPTFFEFMFRFFLYSFLGWVGEVLFTAVRNRRYTDRGILSGPLCLVYGVAGCLISLALRDLTEGWFFIFLGSALYATVIEWVAGHMLERFSQTRWWDYSGRRWNLDGYICLEASAFWGVLGLIAVKWLNPLLHTLYRLIPALPRDILMIALLVLLALDALGTVLTVAGLGHRTGAAEQVSNRLANMTLRWGLWILERVERRMVRTAPELNFVRPKREKSETFAAGCDFYKIAMLFFIGAFLGDITETIYCRITAGIWMSRSSVVWGPFSIVWGLALALVTKLLYPYKDRPASFLFAAGALLGGAYEYLCSVFTEMVFGKVFWDYSAIPFNLGGRINLLYCFFWGFAAVAWFKLVYPPMSRFIESLPRRFGKVMTWCLVVFMAANVVVSASALVRQATRAEGLPAANSVEVWLDTHYDDATLKRIYPNAISTN